MPDQGPAPQLNRAWPRRGWAAPPAFGKSVPGLMAETTVTFQRRTMPVKNDIGGYTAGGWDQTLQVAAHVEIVEEQRPFDVSEEANPTVGFAIVRRYAIYFDLPQPADASMVPVKGDRALFSDGIIQRSIPVASVDLPTGLLDHVEVTTEEVD